jgi:hypothetical protein
LARKSLATKEMASSSHFFTKKLVQQFLLGHIVESEKIMDSTDKQLLLAFFEHSPTYPKSQVFSVRN